MSCCRLRRRRNDRDDHESGRSGAHDHGHLKSGELLALGVCLSLGFSRLFLFFFWDYSLDILKLLLDICFWIVFFRDFLKKQGAKNGYEMQPSLLKPIDY